MTTMRSSSGIACARTFNRVVFPVPVPPLMSSVLPARIWAARNSASGRGKRAASDQVIDGEMAAGELADGERRRGRPTGGMYRADAASVRELRVEQRIVFVEPFAELVGDHFEAGAQPAGVEGNAASGGR